MGILHSKSANAIANIARLILRHGQYLKQLVGTNPNCVRLGAWPRAFIKLATSPDFAAMEWEAALEKLRECKLSKYCDFNLVNVIGENPKKQTFEVRILPSTLDAARIIRTGQVFEAILEWCASMPARSTRMPDSSEALMRELRLPKNLVTCAPEANKYLFLLALGSIAFAIPPDTVRCVIMEDGQ